MSYVALYRTWRPQDFDGLVGQEHIRKALTNALESGRISHAYLFTGPRGTGKTSTARILAKALNCEKGPTPYPCNTCDHCREITEGTSADVIEIDAASNRGIDEIRKLREQVHFAPVSSRYKVYIIDEVHMITADAFNALLKTLEEPPEHVVFILATTEPQKIPTTIHSRCQRFDFRRVTVDDIAAHLQKVAEGSNINAEPDALRLMAIQADGGMRDAVGLLDQCSIMANPVTAETVRQVLGIAGRDTMRALVEKIGRRDLPAALDLLNQLMDDGKDVTQVLTELLEYMRALLLYQADPAYQEIYLTDTAENLKTVEPLFTRSRILAATARIHEASLDVKRSLRSKIVAEICLYDLCRGEGESPAALLSRIETLEGKVTHLMAGGAPAVSPAFEPPREKRSKTQEAAYASPMATAPDMPSVTQKEASFPSAEGPAAIPLEKRQEASFEKQASAVPQRAGQKMEAEGASFTPPFEEKTDAPRQPSDLAGAQRLWNGVLQGLKQRHKMGFFAYAREATPLDFDGKRLTVGTATQLAKDRLERNDLRDEVLAILKAGTGQNFEFAVEQASEKQMEAARKTAPRVASRPQHKAAPPAPPKEAPLPKEDDELPETVKRAMMVFGGSLVKDDSNQ